MTDLPPSLPEGPFGTSDNQKEITRKSSKYFEEGVWLENSLPEESSSLHDVSLFRRNQIDELLNTLGISQALHYELYDHALTHSSFTYENKLSSLQNYERLEFLGDAVLKLIVSEYLFDRFPEYREGELTKIRAVIVSDVALAGVAKRMGLSHYMIFGASEARTGGTQKVSNLACGLEALLGALFLDGKMGETRGWLCDILEDEVTQVDLSKTKDNYKAVLQELTQADGDGLPVYRTAKESGPSHNKTFVVEVLIHQEVVGHGTGKTKKEAQQNAAKMALDVLNTQTD
ncbi:MAG: ribonuclease III [Cyanobacteria bacterium]|nr:ribonuclease III [Cyanobacteriota bacterium]